ncbi:basic salivary proline-rich protein 2-like [Homarus americanus]|uniref:basic salivary proline-rich protein 2-like n=1 Tax=Homarus americanus TaxID=6706 RepID=UPI001C458F9E|nr:basic salivary proline-rich protein 2-like [Homarus americanus]
MPPGSLPQAVASPGTLPGTTAFPGTLALTPPPQGYRRPQGHPRSDGTSRDPLRSEGAPRGPPKCGGATRDPPRDGDAPRGSPRCGALQGPYQGFPGGLWSGVHRDRGSYTKRCIPGDPPGVTAPSGTLPGVVVTPGPLPGTVMPPGTLPMAVESKDPTKVSQEAYARLTL